MGSSSGARLRQGLVRALRARRLARAALWTFVWSSFVAPALHLADHRDDHVHTAAGVQVVLDAHHHGDGRLHSHGSAVDVGAASGPAVTPPRNAPDPGHGQGAADHFGLAFIERPVALPMGPPVATERLALRPVVSSVPPPRSRAAHGPRGPPALARELARG